jgi:hypothetical protein
VSVPDYNDDWTNRAQAAFCAYAASALTSDASAYVSAQRSLGALGNAGQRAARASATEAVLAAEQACTRLGADSVAFGGSGTLGIAQEAYEQLPDDNSTIVVTRTLAFRTQSQRVRRGRRLQAAQDVFVPAVGTAYVPAGWSTQDRAVGSDIAQELQPPLRTIASGNLVLGGLMIEQVRVLQQHAVLPDLLLGCI